MFNILSFIGTAVGTILGVLYVSSPIWLPLVLVAFLWSLWFDYIKMRDISKREYVLIEIRIPKEIKKSPKAMEVILGAFAQGGEGNWYQRYWLGETRPWFSLEIISVGGQIHFLVWMQKKFKNLIENQIYSQYAGVEIYEVPDYTKDTFYVPGETEIWGAEMGLTKADPYPIKTYIDYGLESDMDTKIDPISVAMEFLGSLTEGEQAWMQIMVRNHIKEAGVDTWQEAAKKEIADILDKAKLKTKEEKDTPKVAALSKSQQEAISAIEKSIDKPGFDCGIRLIYFARKDKFNAGNIGGILNTFKQYGSSTLNGFKPTKSTKKGDYPWQDIWGKKLTSSKYKILDAYKRRSFFHPPYKGKPYVLNAEELATIYHIPGKAVATPTLGRIASKKAEPPANLPI